MAEKFRSSREFYSNYLLHWNYDISSLSSSPRGLFPYESYGRDVICDRVVHMSALCFSRTTKEA